MGGGTPAEGGWLGCGVGLVVGATGAVRWGGAGIGGGTPAEGGWLGCGVGLVVGATGAVR
jgi:hypothetical protein